MSCESHRSCPNQPSSGSDRTSRTCGTRRIVQAVAVWLSLTTVAVAQTSPASRRADASAAYSQSFLDNDFTYLDDDEPPEFLGERLKRLELIPGTRFDFGGEVRTRFHDEDNLRVRPVAGFDDDFLLSRMRLFGDLRIGRNVRLFGEWLDAGIDGNRITPRASEESGFRTQNLAVDLTLFDNDRGVTTFRGGRQELILGSQRILSSRPWRNVPVTHDGVRLMHRSETFDADAFWFDSLDTRQRFRNLFIDELERSQRRTYGTYLTRRVGDDLAIDGFYVGFQERNDLFRDISGGIGGFDTHTFGGRYVRTAPSGTQLEIEGGYQFGAFAAEDLSAGYFTAGITRDFARIGRGSTIALYYDWASGDDDPTDGDTGTFVQIIPRGHFYLGYADVTARKNIHDVSVQTLWKATDRLRVKINLHNFWLAETTDALYSPGGRATYQNPNGATSSRVGHELDLLALWNLTPRMNVNVGYSRFWAGSFFDDPVVRGGPAGLAPNGANDGDANFTYVQGTLRF